MKTKVLNVTLVPTAVVHEAHLFAHGASKDAVREALDAAVDGLFPGVRVVEKAVHFKEQGEPGTTWRWLGRVDVGLDFSLPPRGESV